ncbi:MAG: SGNH/GDSL hydrolase family protein [Bacillota bacterium]
MKRPAKKLIAMVAAMFMLFTVFFTSTSASAQPMTLHYVALGDSVTYGMSAYAPTYPYPLYYGYADMLKDTLDDYGAVDYLNAGIPGLDSSEMLGFLTSDLGYRYAVSGRNLVTINIGGNNLLTPFIAAIFSAFGVILEGDITEADFMHLIYNINLMGEEDALAAYSNLNNPSGQLANAFKAGVKSFKNDLPKIIAEVKVLAPDSMITVNTLYNPLETDDPLYKLVDKYVRQINNFIWATYAESGFAVADVYNGFKSYAGPYDLVAFDSDMAIVSALEMEPLKVAAYVDPHPNTFGHIIIATLEFAAYSSPF